MLHGRAGENVRARRLGGALVSLLVFGAAFGAAVRAGAPPTGRVQSVRVIAGYVVPPLWAAIVAGRLETLGYTRVPSARVGGWGGPRGTYAQVPTTLRVWRGGRWLRVYTVPRGAAVLAVAGTEAGVVLVEGPIADLPSLPSAAGTWTVVTVTAAGHATVVWRSPAKETYRSVPLVAATGVRWAAIATVGRHHGPQAAELAVGRFGSAAVSRLAAATSAPATQVVVGRTGGIAVAYPARVRAPRFAAGGQVHTYVGSGYLMALPGGFGVLSAGGLKALGSSREKWENRSGLVGSLVGGSGDGLAAAAVTLSGGRTRSVWTYGPLPSAVRAVLSRASEGIEVTTGGVAAIRFTGNGRRETVYAVWALGARG